MLDEQGLVQRARNGDREAFDALVERHMQQVWRVAYRVLRDADDAADVVQESFLTAWRSLSEFRGDAGFGSWLHRITVTRALNFCDRREQKQSKRALRIDAAPAHDQDEVAPLELADRGPSPLRLLEAEELRSRLAECLAALPPAWRAVLSLREGEGLRYEQIAELQGLVIGTVRSRLARARELLQRCLEEPRR